MRRFVVGDVSEARPLDLLGRYRLLCENAGACRATGTPYPDELREQLAMVEGELQARLWLGWAGCRVDGSESSASRKRRVVAGSPSPSSRQPGVESLARGGVEGGMAHVAGHGGDGVGSDNGGESVSRMATVFCDGACLRNPGPGGYGVVVRVAGHPESTLSAGKPNTTNNEMELTAAVEGLKAAISLGAMEITVVTDSEYLVKGMTGWLRGWLRNGWKTTKGSPVKNRVLWEELHRLCQGRSVTWTWTRGHSGHPENERCDALAVAAATAASRGR